MTGTLNAQKNEVAKAPVILNSNDSVLESAVVLLQNALWVKAPRVGEAAEIPAEFKAFEKIYKDKEAQVLFKRLYKNGNEVSKFYAVVGLQLLNDKDINAYLKIFFASAPKELNFISGCIKYKSDPKKELISWYKLYSEVLKKQAK